MAKAKNSYEACKEARELVSLLCTAQDEYRKQIMEKGISNRVKNKKKRSILFEGIGREVELGKVCSIKIEEQDKEFIYLEKMKDGKWRLSYTEKTLPDLTLLESLKIIREG